MIAQLVLSVLLLVMVAYAFVAARRSLFLPPAIAISALVGLVFVWRPEDATDLAHWAGIGRGADLILYLWVILSMLVSLNLHLRVKAQSEMATKLARKLALLESKKQAGSEES